MSKAQLVITAVVLERHEPREECQSTDFFNKMCLTSRKGGQGLGPVRPGLARPARGR
jgi:hypothetical protein